MLRAEVSNHAVKLGVKTKNADHMNCGPITPRTAEGWYRENMLIDKASPKAIQEILEFSVMDLVKTVLTVCAPEAKLPSKLPNPPAMQKWLESPGVKNYKEVAPPPIAKAKP